ncbi:MAG TPA: glycosyltransferase family 39 protein [Chloroflexota bacterium]
MALRLHGLDAQGLWSDEGGSVRYANLPIPQLLATISAEDPHPPLYYLLLALWMPLAGSGDFAVRLPSALSGTVAVPALYALGRRVGGRATAAFAALFTAFNPLLVWYGQEARMYALLALGATVAALLLHVARQRGSRRAWLFHAAALGTTLYVHYFAAFLAAWHALLVERATRWRPDRWRALGLTALAGLAFAPWLATTRVLGYSGWMEAVDLATTLRRAAQALAVGTSVYPEYAWPLAAPTLLAAAAGAAFLAARRPRADLLLVGGWVVVPVGAAYAFGLVTGRPSFHERYVIAGAPGLMLLAALGVVGVGSAALRLGGAARGALAGIGLALAAGLFCGVLAADARSLAWHYDDPRFGKEDLRGAARFIDARARPDDGLITAPGRAPLYERYAALRLATVVTDVTLDELEPKLESLVVGRERIWQLSSAAEVDRYAERWLDARGYRLDERWFGLAPLKSWVLAPDPPGAGAGADLELDGRPVLRAAGVRFALEPSRDGHVLRVVGSWARRGEVGPLKASLRLVDGRERTVVQSDWQLGGDLSPVAGWPLDRPTTLRFAARVPPDVPGGRYAVRLLLYDGGDTLAVRDGAGAPAPEWRLGEVNLERPSGGSPEQLEPLTRDERRLGDELRLVGHALPTTGLPAGGAATVLLHWQGLGPAAWTSLAATELAVRGASPAAPPEQETLAGVPVGAGLVRDARELRLPRSLEPGSHDVILRLSGPRPQELVVGRVEVDAPPGRAGGGQALIVEAAFGPASLVGFETRGQPRPSGRVVVALHFAPRGPYPRDLTVFVHLIDAAGAIVAQHDGPPCGGGCPTSSWSDGDAIVDEHPIELPGTLPEGRYQLVVGLYDAATGERVGRTDAAPPDQPDRAVLGAITVAS